MKKQLIALTIAALSVPAMAATQGDAWTTGVTTTTGTSVGAGTNAFASSSLVNAHTPNSVSNEAVTEVGAGSSTWNSAFGSAASFNSYSSHYGALNVTNADSMGSGWATTVGASADSYSKSIAGVMTSWYNDGNGVHGSADTAYTSSESEATATLYETVEAYDFGSYSVTIGAH